MTRESMEFDVLIVGAGPAGISAAIRLSQLAKANQQHLSIAVIDKGADVGSHILSGAVLEPRALNELLPDWQDKHPPTHTLVTKDKFYLLSKNKAFRLPTPPPMKNPNNYIISLGDFCVWLKEQAEIMGVSIFPGFAGVGILYEADQVVGVLTDDKGIDKKGEQKEIYQAGIELRAKQILFAEGCRGSLSQQLIAHFQLNKEADPQTYGLGIKEVWQIPISNHHKGLVIHTAGWPLDINTYGGSFVYQYGEDLLAIGYVVGLDYTNPYLNPYEEFQRFKTHPLIKPMLKDAKRIAYGARTIVEGGLQSIPKLSFPGGVLIGDAAGFLNVGKIKGIHNAMKSGMIAAESVFAQLSAEVTSIECKDYPRQLQASWVWKDLYLVRNIRPAMRFGLLLGLLYCIIDTFVFFGRAPFTLHHKKPDHDMLKKAKNAKKINYPKHDNVISFDIMTSVFLTHSAHDENQPCHLKLKNDQTPININLTQYAGPEQRYCPAQVYEILYHENNQPYQQINASNCIHCKACDIKDPTQNIIWTPPEGGSGPQYQGM